MFQTINNPLVKGGIYLGILVVILIIIQAMILLIKSITFKPKRGLSVEDKMHKFLTDSQRRDKTGFEQKYRRSPGRQNFVSSKKQN